MAQHHRTSFMIGSKFLHSFLVVLTLHMIQQVPIQMYHVHAYFISTTPPSSTLLHNIRSTRSYPWNQYKSRTKLYSVSDSDSNVNDNVQINVNNSSSSSSTDCTIRDNITIECVSCRKRCLDVRVFREFSMSAHEYISLKQEKDNITLSEIEAIYELTASYDDDGKDLKSVGGEISQFVAVIDDDKTKRVDDIVIVGDGDGQKRYEQEAQHLEKRTNGVIGTIEAQIKTLNTNNNKSKNHSHHWWPHVSLKNLYVNENYRRMGIASALVDAVEKNGREDARNKAIVLEVDRANKGAVALYEKKGFRFIEENDIKSYQMVLILN